MIVERARWPSCVTVRPKRTGGRIQTETYGFTHQKTRGSSGNLILISDISFRVDFRPEKSSGRGYKNNEGYSDSRVEHSLKYCCTKRYRQTVGFCSDAHAGPS